MGLVVVVLLLAAAAAYLTGGSWSRLSALRLRGRWLVAVAALAQLAGGLTASATGTSNAYPVGLIVSAAAALVFCLRNLRHAGLALVTAGLLANAVVVAANGTMPVSIVAAARAGVPIPDIAAGTDPRHGIAGRGTSLRPLGDVVPVALPWRPEVASPGDVLVAAGLAELIVVTMRRRRSRGHASRWSGWPLAPLGQ